MGGGITERGKLDMGTYTVAASSSSGRARTPEHARDLATNLTTARSVGAATKAQSRSVVVNIQCRRSASLPKSIFKPLEDAAIAYVSGVLPLWSVSSIASMHSALLSQSKTRMFLFQSLADPSN